ncbi:hypothetical protein COOONC_26208 [Cooperia oncophora]
MGGHWGNRFSIILRSIPPEHQSVLDSRLKELEENGFINFFLVQCLLVCFHLKVSCGGIAFYPGMQRFGSCGTSTAEVGKHILKRNWEAAVALILSNDNLPGEVLFAGTL